MGTVLVTGGSGFVGINCIIQLLNKGYTVRTTVRSQKKRDAVLDALARATVNADGRLSFYEADLLSNEGWRQAVTGCDYVLHVASPFPAFVPKDPNDLIRPAKEGTPASFEVCSGCEGEESGCYLFFSGDLLRSSTSSQ